MSICQMLIFEMFFFFQMSICQVLFYQLFICQMQASHKYNNKPFGGNDMKWVSIGAKTTNTCLSNRVTTKFNKNSPNIWKCSQNCSQYIMAQIESPKPQHTTAFNVKISISNHVLKQLQLKM
jgi:hypothetical protein